jgi:hypothetical protein
MKRYQLYMLCLLALFCCIPLVAQDAGVGIEDAADVAETGFSVWQFILLHWVSLLSALLGVIEVVVRLTPTTKDDAGFRWLRRIFDAVIPNKAKQGGTHPAP